MKGNILIVDDEEDILILFKDILEEEGYKVDICNNPIDALELAKQNEYDLILSDMKMPSITGEQFLEKLREFNDFTSFVVMTAYGTIDNAVNCMKKGAFHYLTKPIDFNNPSVWNIIQNAIEKAKLLKENAKLKQQIKQLKEKINIDFIVTRNPKMLKLLEYVKKIAPFDFPVLITGESGTGKELFARAIHILSNRKDKAFIPVNCANISPDIMEAEFFGYVKGAFTGADKDKAGIFEEANGGTVFLDEIGEMPIDIQSKLLRFLQEKEIRRIGETKPKKVDVRIITATNKDLKQLVKQGKFREDLYYRLETIKITLPPLRERKEDIPLLVQHFIDKFNQEFGGNIQGISPNALEYLINYDWEGNIRQLENIIKRIAVFAEGTIKEKDIPEEIKTNSKTEILFDYNKAKQKNQQEFMDMYLRVLLNTTNGNISKAARLANIERQSLQKLLKKYGVNPEDFRK